MPTAIITGASRGLGLALARALAQRGWRLVIDARERDVAALAARGHSNKQIAGALFLSEKTVANTLTRVYAKLNVSSRSQLARIHSG